MRAEEWIEMIRMIPEAQHPQLVLVLQNGAEINIDTLFRYESNYLVIRGRLGGSTDESRGFFIPYDQLLYFRLERVVKLNELRDIYGEAMVKETSLLDAPSSRTPIAEPEGLAAPVPDNGAARNALLERIRSARAKSIAPRPGSGASEVAPARDPERVSTTN